MKRIIALLLAFVALAACVPAHADEYIWSSEPIRWGEIFPYEGMEDALRQAGRFVFGLPVVIMGYNDETALVIIENDGASQMTILRRMRDGTWQIEACNDTIPFHQFNDNEALWYPDDISVEGGVNPLNGEERDDGYFRLDLHQFSGYGFHKFGNRDLYLCIRNGADGWYISGVNLVLFSSEDGTELEKVPYYFLWENKMLSETEDVQDGWSFRYYEFVDRGIGLERTRDPLYTITFSQDEIMAHTRLDAFDYPAFLSWLNSLLPDDLPDSFTVPGTMSDPADASKPEPTAEPADASGKNADASADSGFFYNPQGGRYYHADPNCASVSEEYLPLMPIPSALLDTYLRLLSSCPFCIASERNGNQPE